MTDMKQKQNKIVVIALFGKSGAGKDYLIKTLPPNEYHKIIPTTTRPKRDYEVNGVDYNFITVEDMTAKVLQGNMIEVTDVKTAQSVMRLVDRLEELDDVQNVYTNCDIPDEIAEQLEV